MNIKELEAEREEAAKDKADLFDFYHKYWNSLIEEIKQSRQGNLDS